MGSMKQTWLWIALAFTAGLLVFPVKNRLAPPAPPYPDLSRELQASQAQAEQARKELKSALADLTALRNENLAKDQAKEETDASPPSPQSRPEMPEAMKKAMELAGKNRLSAKLEALKVRLKLTPDQEARLRAILEAEQKKHLEFADWFRKDGLSSSEQIKQLLAPEQLESYQAYEEEERDSAYQSMANMELMQVQSLLQLSDEQKDKVFEALYNSQKSGLSPKDANGQEITDPKAAVEKQMDARLDALRPILTPEQLQIYEKHLNSQKDMIKAFMPR